MADTSSSIREDPCSIRAALVHISQFDKINRCFKFIVLVSSQQNCVYIGIRSHNYTMIPRMLTTFAIKTHSFHDKTRKLCTYYSLNFVLKTGILNPLTSPSILWTILFVCTRSCKMDEIHLLYWQVFTFTIAWKHRVFGSL